MSGIVNGTIVYFSICAYLATAIPTDTPMESEIPGNVTEINGKQSSLFPGSYVTKFPYTCMYY